MSSSQFQTSITHRRWDYLNCVQLRKVVKSNNVLFFRIVFLSKYFCMSYMYKLQQPSLKHVGGSKLKMHYVSFTNNGLGLGFIMQSYIAYVLNYFLFIYLFYFLVSSFGDCVKLENVWATFHFPKWCRGLKYIRMSSAHGALHVSSFHIPHALI